MEQPRWTPQHAFEYIAPLRGSDLTKIVAADKGLPLMPAHALPHQIVALIQHVQLNEAGWWSKSIDQLIKASLWMHGRAAHPNEVVTILHECTGLAISHQEVDAAIVRLKAGAEVFTLDDGRVKLAEHASKAVSDQVEKTEADETGAAGAFVDALNANEWDGDGQKLWTSFRDQVLRPIIRDLGARTYELVEHQRQNIADLEIAKQFLEGLPKADRPQVRAAMQSFMLAQSPKVRRFLLAQMTASFCAASCQLAKNDLEALSRQSDRPIEFILFLDTNFLYSLLQLHDNPSNDSALTLLRLISQTPTGITIKPYVLPTTVDETKANLKANLSHVRRIQSTPNIAHVAQEHLSGVLQRYFRQQGIHSTMAAAEEYFRPYIDNLITLLRAKGVELFNQELAEYRMRQDVIDDVNGRISHEDRKYGNAAREYEPLLHDVILWHVAHDKRETRVESIADAKYWVVTIDYRFLGWDEYKRRGSHGSLQVCLHPSSVVQMLQLWVPRDDELDNALLDSLRLPFFYQEFDAEAEAVTLKILSSISRFENAGDLSEDVVERVVLNNALRSRIALSDDEQKQVALVREALIEQNKLLESRLEQTSRALDERSDELQSIKDDHVATVAELQDALRKQQDHSATLEKKIEMISLEQLDEKRRRCRRSAGRTAWVVILGVAVCIIVAALYGYPSVAAHWGWLEPVWAIITLAGTLLLLLVGFKFDALHLRKRLEEWLYGRFCAREDIDPRSAQPSGGAEGTRPISFPM